MGAKRLNDVVADIVDRARSGERVDARQAAVDVWDDIDSDGQYLCGIDGLISRIANRTRSLKFAAANRRSEAQPELPFSLPAVVAMDTEGHVLLATRLLTRAEFVRAIEIREKQIKDDRARLSAWVAALASADRFWLEHPDWCFGRCLDAIMNEAAA